MPVGLIRRLARQSFRLAAYVPGVNVQNPSLQDNWTTEETDTYIPATPADGPLPWGGTVADLDRVLTATGSGYTVLGALLTFLYKPETNNLGQLGSFGGLIVKVQPTFPAGSTAALEVWSYRAANMTWTKRRRIPLAGLVRSGEVVVIDATGPVLPTSEVDAYWVTLAPDIGTETITWLAIHAYGICPTDDKTSDCPAGTPPEQCAAPQCGVNVTSWLCQDPPEEPDPPATPTDPFVLPPIIVGVPMPTTYTKVGAAYFHDCPRPTRIQMFFGEIPSGGSVTVTVANAAGILFAEGVQQVISAPGTMTWTVTTGFHAANAPLTQALPPAAVTAELTFLFTRQLDDTAFAVAGNLLDILMYFWTYALGYVEVC